MCVHLCVPVNDASLPDKQPPAPEEETSRFAPDSRSGEGAETALQRLKELQRRHAERPESAEQH